jgi:hypothetical protein
MRFNSVDLPAPRKPVRMVVGIRAMAVAFRLDVASILMESTYGGAIADSN